MPGPLTIGVHGAGLARAQAEYVATALRDAGAPFAIHLELVTESSASHAVLHDDHVAENRGTMRRLHRLLDERELDVVIHAGFDLRGEIPDGLCIGAVLRRDNPFDALLGPIDHGLDEFAADATLGVVHLRARAQLMEYRPDLHYELVTGDAGDWLTALIDGRVEALVAPAAAVERLSLQSNVCEIFPPELLVPGAGAGILICLCREGDAETMRRLRPLHDAAAACEYTAECSFMESMGGAWESAIGVLARRADDRLELTAVVARADASIVLRERHSTSAEDPCLAGAELAALMIAAGADRLVEFDDEDEAEGCEIAGRLPRGELGDWEDAQVEDD